MFVSIMQFLNKNIKSSNSKGFTLLELMIVIGLIVIFTALTIPYGMQFYDSRVLQGETTSVFNVLERARVHAVSGKEDSDWGIDFSSPGEYHLLKGSNCDTGEVFQTFSITSGVEIDTDISCIIFEKNTGKPKIYN